MTAAPPSPSLDVLGTPVAWADAEGRVAYTSGAQKSVALAKERGWPLVSVREDWAKVFVE